MPRNTARRIRTTIVSVREFIVPEPAPAAVMADAIRDAPSEDWLYKPLSQREAAAWLNISRTQLSLLTSAGIVPVAYIGSSPKYLRADLLPLLRSGRLRTVNGEAA